MMFHVNNQVIMFYFSVGNKSPLHHSTFKFHSLKVLTMILLLLSLFRVWPLSQNFPFWDNIVGWIKGFNGTNSVFNNTERENIAQRCGCMRPAAFFITPPHCWDSSSVVGDRENYCGGAGKGDYYRCQYISRTSSAILREKQVLFVAEKSKTCP